MQKPFEGQTALVTGASSGIGAATAVAFGARGAHVIVHYNSRKAEAEEVLGTIQKGGGAGEILQADLANRKGIHALCDAIKGRTIDLLINNAGSLVKRTKVVDFTEEFWDQVIDLNLTSTVFISKTVLEGMVERKRGCVINISSVAARNGGGPGALAYATSKAAINAVTKGLAKEFAPQGIRVNCVSPGTIDTNFHRTFSTEQMLTNVRNTTPAGHIGTSEEVADVIAFLCTDEARYIHGQSIEVNGGFLMV